MSETSGAAAPGPDDGPRGGAGRGWRVELWLPVAYAALAALWIATSDAVVAAIAGSAQEAARWSTLKGFGFIAVTTAGLWLGLEWALGRVRRAEAELRRSEARLRRFVEHAPARVAMFDREMRFVVASRRWLVEHGIDASALGRPLYEVHPHIPPAWRDVHRRCLAGAVETCDEDLAPWSTPERPEWLRWECRPWHDDRGEIGGVIISSESITERRRAAEAARRYELLAEASRDPILFIRPDGRILEANRAAVEAYGWTHAELLDRSVIDLRAEQIPAEVERQLRAADLEGVLFETRHRRKDGTTFPVEVNSKGAEVGGARVLVSVVRDLTARNAAAEALAAREHDLRIILETALDGIAVSGAHGRLLEVNDAFCAMLGYSRDELVGRPIADIEAVESAADIANRIARMSRTGGDRIDSRYRRKDGTLVDVEVSIRRIDAGGVRFAAFIRDVTESRRLKDRLHQAEKLESIGRLAGGVAHDFNNLLTVIMSCAEGLRASLEAGQSPFPEDVEEIQAAGRRAGELTRQLLAFARKQVITPVTLDLLQAIRGSERLLRRVLGEDVTLTVSGAAELWRVRCDPGQLEQVVLNLALNARDAMPHGGRLSISLENVELGAEHVAVHPFLRPGPYVRLSFADNGRGMPPEVKSHLFEPFFTTKPRGQGTGLGLATVYGIVKQSEGYILAESEEGSGTRFEVYLPRVGTTEAAAEAREAPAARGGSETILVVEDEALVRGVTARSLVSAGYRVLVAADGGEALAIAASEPRLDLLVTDVIMPGKSGRAVADELRRERPGLRVLFVSGYPRDAISRAGVLDSGIEFLPKPFTPSLLQERVRHVLDQR